MNTKDGYKMGILNWHHFTKGEKYFTTILTKNSVDVDRKQHQYLQTWPTISSINPTSRNYTKWAASAELHTLTDQSLTNPAAQFQIVTFSISLERLPQKQSSAWVRAVRSLRFLSLFLSGLSSSVQLALRLPHVYSQKKGGGGTGRGNKKQKACI